MSLFTDYTPFPPLPPKHSDCAVVTREGVEVGLARVGNRIEIHLDAVGANLTKADAKILMIWLVENYWELDGD